MNNKRNVAVTILAIICLISAMFVLRAYGRWPYNSWWDVNDDGKIDIQDLARVSGAFGTYGSNLTKASVEYDSGWMNITGKAGKSFTVTHDLNSVDIMVDVQGKTEISGAIHQRNNGLTGCIHGWIETYTWSRYGAIYALVQAKDGGYGLAGFNYDFYKTDANGVLQWKMTYPGEYSNVESIVQTTDTGYGLAGSDPSGGAKLVKTNPEGVMEWNKTYGGASFGSVIVSTDGGFALGGRVYTGSNNNGWLVKTNAQGVLQWSKTYGGTGNDDIKSVLQTADGGYIMLGYTASSGAGGYDLWLIKTNSIGTVSWTKTYGGTNDERAGSIIKTSDGGYALSGSTLSLGSTAKFWLVKVDSLGNTQWTKTFAIDKTDYYSPLVQTSEGGYALTGNNLLIKTDSNGNQQWNKTFESTASRYSSFTSIVQSPDGALILAGDLIDTYAEFQAPLLVRIDTECGITWACSDPNAISVYRGATDPCWNFVRIRIWKVHNP